jgi:CRP-like cAMP-binding protein
MDIAALPPLARKLGAFVALRASEISYLERLQERPVAVPAGTDLVTEGQVGHAAYVIQAGWGCAYRMLPDGGRQVIDVSLPGDVMGVRSILLRTADHALSAVTDLRVSRISKEQLLQLFEEQPRIALGMLWAVSRDEALVVEHLVGIGRRDALHRTAHFLVELGLRLQLIGLGTVARYPCPLRQAVLADTLGLSAIHLNRVLRQLREDGLLTFTRGQVIVPDVARLTEFAGYDSDYLTAVHTPILR